MTASHPQSVRRLQSRTLAPGHVSVITGTSLYETLRENGVSGVVAGFKADEIIAALAVIVQESEKGKPFFRNCYPGVVKPEGNPIAMKLIGEVAFPECKIVALEPHECSTLTNGGRGQHRIEGIGDKMCTLIHNVLQSKKVLRS